MFICILQESPVSVATRFGCNSNDSVANAMPVQRNGKSKLEICDWSVDGDDGTNPDLDVQWGPNTVGSDLLYHTQTSRKAFAAYTQGCMAG